MQQSKKQKIQLHYYENPAMKGVLDQKLVAKILRDF